MTTSAVKGIVRSRTPVASKMALEMADGITLTAGSPTPEGGICGLGMRIVLMIAGVSAITRIG